MLTRLVFVRHAEALGNINREFHGWTDSIITSKGHLQAQKVAERLKDVPIDAIYSSSLKRTLQTAGYIAEVKNLPIIKTDNLKEINGGDWEGRRWDELPILWPDEYNTWEYNPHLHKMPNGESMVEFTERLLNEIQNIIRQNEGKNICIVTHGTAIRTMMCSFICCNREEMVNVRWYDNTSVTVIDFENEVYKVITEGDSSHLDKDMSTIENQEWWDEYIENLKKRVNTDNH